MELMVVMTQRSVFSRLVAGMCSAVLLFSCFVQAGTVTGQVQLASTGKGVANGILTFTLSQAAVVSGSGLIVTSPVNCYTDSSGNVVGEPTPLLASVVTTMTASGTLPAATYYVRITYYDGSGETVASPETAASLSAQGTLIVNAPARQPAGASGYKVYIGTASGAETLQGSVTGTPGSWANYSQTAPLVNGSALPGATTAACSLRFNDELQPSYTGYIVTLTNSAGAGIPGFPQQWYLAG